MNIFCYTNGGGGIIAELSRAKRASEAPCVIEIGNPSSQENLVITSAYERPSERTPSVQTLGVEEGRFDVSLTGDLRNAIFSRRNLSEEKAHLYLLCQTFREVDLTFKIGSI